MRQDEAIKYIYIFSQRRCGNKTESIISFQRTKDTESLYLNSNQESLDTLTLPRPLNSSTQIMITAAVITNTLIQLQQQISKITPKISQSRPNRYHSTNHLSTVTEQKDIGTMNIWYFK